MSQLQAVRVRSQRTAAAAVQRARLTLVQTRPSSAPRAPFAVLVFLILALGVVGLLMFNTHMQQASFAATKLQNKADALQAKSEALNLRLERMRDPQNLAKASRKLGMVTPPNPAMIDLRTGRTLGLPLKAEPKDRTFIMSLKMPVPPDLNRPPIIKKVVLPATPAGQTPTAQGGLPNGPASTGNTPPAGTNAQNQSVTGASGAPR